MNSFPYAKPAVFQYQVFDSKTFQYTSVPARRPPSPPPVEPDESHEVTAPEVPGGDDEPADGSPADDVAGEYTSCIESCFNGT